MKRTFKESYDKLISLGFETHFHSGDKEIIGMTHSCDSDGNKCALFDAKVTYNITYNVNKDTFELGYNTKRWTFSLLSGDYTNIDRTDLRRIMHDFFIYCESLENTNI